MKNDTILSYTYNCGNNTDWGKQNGNSAMKDSDIAIGAQYQVARAYDFYKNVFGWKGTDGNNAKLVLFPQDPASVTGDAWSSPYYNTIGFGKYDESAPKYKYAALEMDTPIHEYTHRVLRNKLLWNLPCAKNGKYYGESNSLNEAYADILGEYGQLYCKGSIDWKVGNEIRKDGSPFRDISRGNDYEERGAKHHFKVPETSTETSLWDSHAGSTVISHAAYRMEQYQITSGYARSIWYNSIAYLQGTSYTFRNCRTAVTKSAENKFASLYSSDVATRKRFEMRVHSAFNYARIFPNSVYKMGDINGDGKVTMADATIISSFVTNSSTWKTTGYTAQTIAKGDLNYDGIISQADVDIIKKALSNGTETEL